MTTRHPARRSGGLTSIAAASGLFGLALLLASPSPAAAQASLPRPQVVVVADFAFSPDQVKIHEGLADDVRQALDGGQQSTPSEEERAAGGQVATALAEKLVVEIKDLGFEAERGSDLPAGVENGLLITGQIVSIDEGNRAERVIIGLGAGRSSVRVDAQVYALSGGERQHIDTISVDGKSGHMPGMAETMGVGAAAGHLAVAAAAGGGLHVISEKFGASVVADADRAARGIAKQLAVLFGEEGWGQ